MSFTFDDVEKPMPPSVAMEMERLSERIRELKSDAGPHSAERQIALERRRQQLAAQHGYGLKAPKLPRAVDDNW